jgi:hypothetical protein
MNGDYTRMVLNATSWDKTSYVGIARGINQRHVGPKSSALRGGFEHTKEDYISPLFACPPKLAGRGE